MPAQDYQFGRRLFPRVLDEHSNSSPHRIYGSVPRDATDLSRGFRDVTVREMAQCTDVVAHWLDREFGRSDSVETICYIGIPDLRGAAFFLAGVKCGYKVLFPSPRNPAATNLSLLEQTACKKLVYSKEVAKLISQLQPIVDSLKTLQIASFDELLEQTAPSYLYNETFDEVRDKSIVILHSSGSTGLPKPITMTHGSFATLDNERNLPTLPNRKNRDLSVYNFDEGGGKFYTVFPYFHLAGFNSIVFNPIFTEASSPVLGPALMPPSGDLLKQVMKYQKLRALYIPPSLAEQLLQEPNGIDFFRELDFLCYTGGPFSQKAGEALAEVTELCPLYGCTETFQVPQLRPRDPRTDFAYMEWNPCCKLEMEPSDDEVGTYEMIMFADDSNKDTCALHYNKPGIPVWRTRDLFKRHPDPSKPDLWRYYGRRDDIVVLSNGEKFNPVPMELIIQGHPLLAGALILGLGRKQAALIVEPKDKILDLEIVIETIWPLVEKANLHAPGQGRILRSMILAASPDKPFTRAGKGTIVRKLTEKAYSEEIESLYSTTSRSTQGLDSRRPTLVPTFPLSSVTNFVREAVALSLPSAPDLSGTDDFYTHGLDSLKTSELCDTLRNGLKEFRKSFDLSWISTRFIYEHSTIKELSSMLYEFLHTGQAPESSIARSKAFQARTIEAMVEEFASNPVPKKLKTVERKSSDLSIALTGSTGSLGTELLHNLLTDSLVSKIYCLNRTSDAEVRQTKALESRFAISPPKLSQITYLTVDLSKPQLGLQSTDYDNLLTNVDIIIHNAWKVDFNLPLRSFTPHIRGISNLITWSLDSPKTPRLMFVSSISCVLNHTTPSTNPKEPPLIPETPPTSPTHAVEIGYAQSKYVAERLLTLAHRISNVPVSILRAGQIGGSTRPNDVATPRQEWLISLIETSQSLGIIPADVSLLDWIPINELAESIIDILHTESESKSSALKVFNLVNPHPMPWSRLLDTLSDTFNITANRIPLREWVHELGLRREQSGVNLKALPAIDLLGFFEALEGGKEVVFETGNSEGASERFGKIEGVSRGWLEVWLRQWGL